MENNETGMREETILAAEERPRETDLPLPAEFLKGKGGQTGCKRRNFKRKKKS